jgi:xanthine dehydrogenase small subunit
MHDQVLLLLNGKRHAVPGSVPPTRTLLDYLREDLGLKGTKEGCAEGDCGACTVVIRRSSDDLARAVNACIVFVPMVDGFSVTTVEGVKGPSGELHPCQQAMVECHGSQCGFCTPGFVMSLFALYRRFRRAGAGATPTRAAINDSLAGNLCRCTGYGTIIASAERMFQLPEPSWEQARNEEENRGLADLRGDGSLRGESAAGRYFAPTSRAELIGLAQRYGDARFLGGATDVGLWVTKQHREIPVVISTTRVAELRELKRVGGDGPLRIGAAVTYAEAMDTLAGRFPSLGELVRRIGSEQVRNLGTIGGNVANGSPIGDMPPALIALGATLVLNGPDGERRMPLEDFFVAYGEQDRKPGEFVDAVEIPVGQEGARSLRCYKVSKRFDQDISAVCGCFVSTVERDHLVGIRIAYGGMAAVPRRAKAVEAALLGKTWSLESIEAAMPAFETDFQPISDMRASSDYRLRTARNLLLRYFHETISRAATQLVGANERITAEISGTP